MSEVKYESKIVSCASRAGAVYGVCSDMRQFEKVRELMPKDKIQEMECEEDLVRFKVDGLGQKVGLRIIAKEPGDYIKYGIENAPVDGNFWIQIKETEDHETKIRLTLKADLPLMFKMMLESKIQTALDQAADMMAKFPFDEWAAK